MDHQTLANVIIRAQKLDPEAVGILYIRNFSAIYNYFRYRLDDPSIAEDMTSELFIKMVQGLPNYRLGSAPFRSWLFKIAKNLVADYYRDCQGSKILSLEITVDKAEALPDSRLLEKEIEVVLREAILTVTTNQREVILLRFFADLTFREIADLLGKSEASVKMLQRRGLTALGERLRNNATR